MSRDEAIGVDEALERSVNRLMSEIDAGVFSGDRGEWIGEADIVAEFGVVSRRFATSEVFGSETDSARAEMRRRRSK